MLNFTDILWMVFIVSVVIALLIVGFKEAAELRRKVN